jgi:hypothetical protein
MEHRDLKRMTTADGYDWIDDLMAKKIAPKSIKDVWIAALSAASVAERMLLEGEPVPSVSDVEHTIKYASLVCRSPEAADRFIRLCETMADDLLRPYGYVLIALSTVLRIRRTLSGEEIDNVIATTVAGFELASEQARRRRWQRVLERAAEFKTVSS